MGKKLTKKERELGEKLNQAIETISLFIVCTAEGMELPFAKSTFAALDATRIFIESAVEVNMFGEETTFEKIKEHKPEIEKISKGVFEQYIKAVWK